MNTKNLTYLIVAGCLVLSVSWADDVQKPLPLRRVTTEPVEEKKSTPAVETPVAAPVSEETSAPIPKTAKPATASAAKDPVATIADDSSPVEIQPADSGYFIEVGTRILYVELLDDSQGTTEKDSFIGSITGLDADQDYSPTRPYVQVMVPRKNFNAGVGLSYDHMTVATVDDGGGDGDIDMEGLHLYLVVACTKHEFLSPYGEIGIAFYDNSFDPHADWSDNGNRAFNLDDSTAPYFAAGCALKINEDWAVDFYLRYVDVDVDGKFIFKPDGREPEPFTFTLEHLAYGLGVKYVF